MCVRSNLALMFTFECAPWTQLIQDVYMRSYIRTCTYTYVHTYKCTHIHRVTGPPSSSRHALHVCIHAHTTYIHTFHTSIHHIMYTNTQLRIHTCRVNKAIELIKTCTLCAANVDPAKVQNTCMYACMYVCMPVWPALSLCMHVCLYLSIM
jgi:hypothetical protein